MTMTHPCCIVVCIVVCIAVLHSCSCCCHWHTVVFAITVYCCILFFVLFFLFLLLLLLSVVCRQCLLLCHRPSFVVICLPLLVAITVYCCFICFALCHIVLFVLLFVLLFCVVVLVVVLVYSRLCYHSVLLYSFLHLVLVALVVGCVPSMSSFVVCRHLLAPSCCNHGVLLFCLFRVVSHCVVSIVVRIVVLHSCSFCCPCVQSLTEKYPWYIP